MVWENDTNKTTDCVGGLLLETRHFIATGGIDRFQIKTKAFL